MAHATANKKDSKVKATSHPTYKTQPLAKGHMPIRRELCTEEACPLRRGPKDQARNPGPDHRPKIRVTNCILRPLATLRPSPVAFATIYRGRLGGRVGASPLRNSDRKQAPGAEVSPSRTHWTGAVSVVRNCFHGRRTWCRIGRACPSASGSPLWMLTTTILVRVFCLLVRRGGGDTAAPRPDQRPDTGHSGLVVGASAWRRLLQGTRQPAPRRSSHPGEGRRFWRPYRPAYASGDRGRTHRGL